MPRNLILFRKILLTVLLIYSFGAKSQLINYGGNNFFLSGPNIAWNNYGWDFGDNSVGYGGGNGFDSTWWDNTFADVENYGGNCVRVWIHCKAEHNPLFDVNGKCTGLNNNFFNNLDVMLQRAEHHNLMVILCLFDYQLVDVGRAGIIKDTSKTNAYIREALIPMVQRYDNQCNLIAWEIINEPEWIMQGIPGGGNYGSSGISVNQMQRFVGLCSAAIHSNCSKYVTVGSASLKWNTSITPANGNYWSNNALKSAAYNNTGAYLDFYQIHYYDWMGNAFSPYAKAKDHWSLDKPVLIGETGNEGYFTYQQQFDYAYSNGYAGCMPWAYQSGGVAAWSDFNTEMNTFKTNNSSVVSFSCSILPIYEPTSRHKAFTIPTCVERGSELKVILKNVSGQASLRLYDTQGTEYLTISVTETNDASVFIPTSMKSGLYMLRLKTEKGIYTEKLIVL